VAQQEPQVLVATVPEKNLVYFHDAWNEYAVVLPEKIRNLVSPSVLDCTTGLSRLTMASTLNFNYRRTNFNWPLIENS
jgi:hypothetical protein